VNTAYAQLVLALGPARVVDMAHQLGIRSPLQAVPSIALGTQDVSVLEMADAYSTFARGGYQVDPEVIQKVTTADGTVLEDNHPRRTRVLDRRYADQVTYALRRVVTSGTGTAAAFGKPVAGKTGTTEDYGDAWFVGYTPKLTAAVWMGYSEGQSRPMTDVHGRKVNGGSFPAVIFSKFMDQATRGVDTGSFSEPGPFTGIRLGPPADVVVPSAPAGTTDVSPTTMHALSRPTTTVTVAPPPPRATTTTSPYDGGDPADPGDGGDIRPP
jgi:membrane peptidoglycan carboxypeptidase